MPSPPSSPDHQIPAVGEPLKKPWRHRSSTTMGDRLEEFGAMANLAGKTVVSALRPPYTYGHELVSQINFAVRIGWLPMVLTAFALSFGPAGVQASGFLKLFGALDRLGGLFVVAVIREFGPIVCAIVVAGVAGASMCADLGARRIREEIDALAVLGVDPVKSLVVPRFVALIVITTLFDIYALLFGTFGGIVVTLYNRAPLGPFFHTYFENASTTEFLASFIKTALFGAVIAIVSCYKGITASGGPEGVGRAVNEAVVTSFLFVGAVNYVFTQVLLATHPSLLVPK
jgi:phospholipid/cholesterol/gamma-HCH transport system permease protein